MPVFTNQSSLKVIIHFQKNEQEEANRDLWIATLELKDLFTLLRSKGEVGKDKEGIHKDRAENDTSFKRVTNEFIWIQTQKKKDYFFVSSQ